MTTTNDDKRALIVSHVPDFDDGGKWDGYHRSGQSFGLPLLPESIVDTALEGDFGLVAFYRFSPQILVFITHLIVISRDGNSRASLFEPNGRELLPLELIPGQQVTFSLELTAKATRTVWVRGYAHF